MADTPLRLDPKALDRIKEAVREEMMRLTGCPDIIGYGDIRVSHQIIQTVLSALPVPTSEEPRARPDVNAAALKWLEQSATPDCSRPVRGASHMGVSESLCCGECSACEDAAHAQEILGYLSAMTFWMDTAPVPPIREDAAPAQTGEPVAIIASEISDAIAAHDAGETVNAVQRAQHVVAALRAPAPTGRQVWPTDPSYPCPTCGHRTTDAPAPVPEVREEVVTFLKGCARDWDHDESDPMHNATNSGCRACQAKHLLESIQSRKEGK